MVMTCKNNHRSKVYLFLLTDLNQEENILETYTSIQPFIVYQEEGRREVIVTLPENFVDSEHVNAYPHRRVLPIDFTSEFDERSGELLTSTRRVAIENRLRLLSQQHIKNHQIGVPHVSMTVKFVDLTRTLGFKGARDEQLNLCDTVPIRFEKLGISTEAKITRVRWNVLKDSYDELHLGDIRPTLSDQIRTIVRDVNEVERDANNALVAANGSNTVFFGPNEPMPPLRVGDLWYRTDGIDTFMYSWNGAAWQFRISTVPDERIMNEIRENMETVNEKFDGLEPLLYFNDPISGERTRISAVAGGLQSAVFDARGESRITQLADRIDLSVRDISDMNRVVSQIHVNTDGIFLQGRQIRLTGQSYIEEAIIEDAHIINLNGSKITANSISAGAIATDAVIARTIATNAVTADKISANAVTAVKINSNAVITRTINAEAVTAAKIATNAVVARTINANAITADKIATGAVTADKLHADAIRVGFNAVGKSIQLHSNRIEFSRNGMRYGELTGEGWRFYQGNNHVSSIMNAVHFSNNLGFRGLGIALENHGAFIALGNQSSNAYGAALLINPTARIGNFAPGIHSSFPISLPAARTIGFGENNMEVDLGVRKIDDENCFFIGDKDNMCGIAFGKGKCYVVDEGKNYRVKDLMS